MRLENLKVIGTIENICGICQSERIGIFYLHPKEQHFILKRKWATANTDTSN